MWGDKKSEAPGKKAVPQQPQTSQQVQSAKPTVPSANAPAYPGEAKTMAPNDPTYPNTSSGNTARLGSSLHVKGEITGNEDLLIDGTVEGLVQLEDRKLTVGASAKVTADVIAINGKTLHGLGVRGAPTPRARGGQGRGKIQ